MIQYPLGVEGFTTRVLEAGSGDANMVLVHGVGARADRWSRVIDLLADEGYHVYAFDLPGHGLAHKGPGPDYSVPGYTNYLRSFMREVGLDERPVVLVGTSLGGHVSAMLTTREPALVSALVLVGSVGLMAWGPERRAATRDRLGEVSEEGIRRKLSIVVHDQVHVTDAWVQEERKVNSSPGAAESFASIAEYIAARLDDDLVLDALADLDGRVPIQLIWGAEERSVPLQVGQDAHRALPGSELHVMPGVAHAPFFEEPLMFVSALKDFLDRMSSV
jgi:2-hydroxy-6-oxonona-2,4-dienedioate hydrolase